jgi:DNA-nicking Smr family endonuclease
VKARLNTLADLKQVKQALAEQARLQAAERAAAELAQRRGAAQKNLFRAAVGAVQPLGRTERVPLRTAPPAPVPVQHLLDEQAVLRATLSDSFDAGSLLETDSGLSYTRPGVGPEVTRRLRKGEWSVQREIDLHGLRTDDARDALAQFIREAHRQGIRCVRVVHGKGLGSPAKTPVLKSRVHNWLLQKSQVMAYVQARPLDGGAGAVIVLLG